MMWYTRYIVLISLLCLMAGIRFCAAQNITQIKGLVADTASAVNLADASVILLQARDSILFGYVWADSRGAFTLNGIPAGHYILTITYPAYADYSDTLHIGSTAAVRDLGRINLSLKSQLLQEVVIQGHQMVTLKGDTIEFDAGSYVIQKNDRVEDLLKQLPGIQVDRNGRITAEGQRVKRVLVDGEEFFGNDPTLVTRNVRADMVDKIQLYDKKSEQAEFTGIDDGKKEKTINVKLREDKKNGLFGKVGAGGATEYYEGTAMFNRFKTRQKFAAYGIMGTTGKAGLDWGESSQYGSGSGVDVSTDGSFAISTGGDEISGSSGSYAGQGKPRVYNGGLHYDTQWDERRNILNLNAKSARMDLAGNSNSINQNNLPGQALLSTADQLFNNRVLLQKIDGSYEAALSETANLRITADAGIRDYHNKSRYMSETRIQDATLLNQQERSVGNNQKSSSLNATVAWNKRFKKVGRTLSVSIRENYSDARGNTQLFAQNDFFDRENGLMDSSLTVDQFKRITSGQLAWAANAAYTEALGAQLSFRFNYTVDMQQSDNRNDAFNASPAGIYDVPDPLFSNDFRLRQSSHTGGLSVNYNSGKTLLSAAARISAVSFRQSERYSGGLYDRQFNNFMPTVSYRYSFSASQSINLGYYGNPTQPTVSQVQPLRENTDPLNVTIGNPDLKPSFTHQFTGSYRLFDRTGGRGLNVSGSYRSTPRAIVLNTATDEAGKSTYRYLNLHGAQNTGYSFSIRGNMKLHFWDLQLTSGLGADGNTYANYVNNDLNKTQATRYVYNLGLSKFVNNTYDLGFSLAPAYQQTKTSLQTAYPNNGYNLEGSLNARLFLPAKLELSSDFHYSFTQKTAAFDQDFNRTLWNASIARKFLNSGDLLLKLAVNDLLNQQVGFSRSVYNNQVSQQRYTTIRRFFLLSVVWDFNKTFGK